MAKTNPNFLNGVPELLILQLLSRREMYGYEIVREIQERSGDVFTFGEGCVYPILHHLEKSKLLSSDRKEVGGRVRTYYAVTANGRKRLAELAAEWQRVGSGVSAILEVQHA